MASTLNYTIHNLKSKRSDRKVDLFFRASVLKYIMMIERLNYEKGTIGLLIAYYRKNKLMTIKEMMNDDNGAICTFSTLRSIESGKSSRDDFYYRLAKNLGLDVTLAADKYSELYRLRKKLMTDITDLSATRLKEDLNAIEKKLKAYDKTLYLRELLSMYRDIVIFILEKRYPSKENVHVYHYLKDHLAKEDKMICLYLLISVSSQFKELMDVRMSLFGSLDEYPNEEFLFPLRLRRLFYGQNSLSYVLDKLNEIDQNRSLYHGYLIYDCYALLFADMNMFDKAQSYIDRCLDIAKRIDISDPMRNDLYGQAAIIAYSLKDYDKAIAFFDESIKYGNNRGIRMILYFDALERTDHKDKLKAYLYDIDVYAINNHYEKLVTKYYKEKYHSIHKGKKYYNDLEDIILDDLVEVANFGGDEVKKILFDDLSDLVSKTKAYSKLHRFKEVCSL